MCYGISRFIHSRIQDDEVVVGWTADVVSSAWSKVLRERQMLAV